MSRALLTLVVLLLPGLLGAAPTQLVPADKLIAAARAGLDARIGEESGNAQVVLIGAPEDITVPSGSLRVNARPMSGRWPRSRLGVPVDVVVDGRMVRSATVWFSLELHRPVLSYAQSYPGESAASSVDLATMDADVAAMQGEIVSKPDDLKGLQLRRPVPAGAVALMQDFVRIPDVKRGEHIDVLVQHGSIRMSARGVAIDRGLQGETVPVLVDGAESPVQAQITARGVVQVVQ